MAAALLPTASSILTPAIDAIVAARPEALQFFNAPTSRWLNLPAMWRAQLMLLIARLGDECNSARLSSATGDALRQLAASEFNTVLPSAPQQALGTVPLLRPMPTAIPIAAVLTIQATFGVAAGTEIITQTPHGLVQGQGVYIAGLVGATGPNGVWNQSTTLPTIVSPTVFTLPVAPGGVWTSGTGTVTAIPLAGVIPKGSKFVKAANPLAKPAPIAASSYTSTTTVYVPTGGAVVGGSAVNGMSAAPASVPVLADSGGSGANVPSWTDSLLTLAGVSAPNWIAPATALFDATLFSQGVTAGGGSSGLTDPVLVAACKAYAIGQFGPTDGALIAGILQTQAVRHYALFPATSALPYAQLYVADESWAYDSRWIASVQQALNSAWVGFGGRARVGFVINQPAVVAPTLVLKDSDDLAFTDEITANVAAVVESYFDDRPDWYRWRSQTLQALLAMADSRILHCTGLSVTDQATGAPLSETLNVATSPTYGQSVAHVYTTNATVQPTYLPPS